METAPFLALEMPGISGSPPEATLGHEQDVESVVQRALAGKQPITRRIERRRDVRYAYPYPLTLLPLDAVLRGESTLAIPAIGKHVAMHGIDFYTTSPVAAKEVVCQFHSPCENFALVLELNWCRHNAQGWFENGGRFLRVWRPTATARP
jgi:hypothetical protein